MSSAESQSWSQQYGNRRAVAAKFGGIFDLPVTKRCWQVLNRHLRSGQAVLEVGAGDRNMEPRVHEQGTGLVYESMDIDPNGNHDYRSFGEIERQYDTVFAFEVVEHVPTESLASWLEGMSKVTRPGGQLILSTPNIYYPPAYLRDITHQTPLCFDELGGLLKTHGFDVEQVVRCHNLSGLKMVLRRYCFGWVFRLMRIDFAPQIVIVGRRLGHQAPTLRAA